MVSKEGQTMEVNKQLPKYSHGEEVSNSITHLIGFLFALGAAIYFVVFGYVATKDITTSFPFLIYTFFMMVMFFMSFLYHSRENHSKSKMICRIIDHCDIYLFVAATYTPICIFGIENKAVGITLLSIEWGLALIGVIMNAISLNNKLVKIFSMIIYIFGGWAIIFFYPFNIGIPYLTFFFVLLGGIMYTIGAVLYGIGSKKPWFHTIFHCFVLVAAILQFIGIVLLY